ncbi:glycosyltransferase [Carnobacterium maltaromaticum]|uniref:glycosyltransferase family 2 protein n=1 Tax=Carnobacterium TaxID=2747 RepID=UPI0007056796|nr:glycosyltransferase family 2 protein [Carnobacterium maltaromaticum]KRN72025.1 putative teichoic acid polysaccharide glycosyl transferase, family 2 [Carnobacterium maltaromaticum]KRN85973.1 putative teichoic acid polysaccharide glycosyl transferase, family 2 [Carnobacterium maltaromaticum]MDT1943865.1 glycosyltransferase family 2 protein [Carnobacterium maltaromaticum]MDT1999245.1 glycosyltransferase family 2 protein [Carnobacterium maltaromaticum]TFJ24328.1 glycosyltransferase [Carnobacter
MKTELISIVVPCFNEEESIPLFYAALEKEREFLVNADIEYIFVNDGSNDNTLNVLRSLAKEDRERVKFISFSRNFGKEAGLYAGLQQATGDYVAVMDVDLQDPPEMLPEMLQIIREEEYDCVGTRRVSRDGEPPIRSFFARQFYRIINNISETEIVDGARDYRLMTRQMVNAILSMEEYNRFSKGIFSWVGFDTKYLEYKNQERVAGETSWSFWSLFKYSLDGIVAFSELPLAFASFVGFFSFLAAMIAMVVIVIRTLLLNDPTSGWPSLVCFILAIGGLQLFCLGILGKYLGKTYLETKKRPIYIVKETEKDKK